MCYLLNTTYGCTSKDLPGGRPSHPEHPHQTRTSVLCSNVNTCPTNLWETRNKRWDALCPNCTGDDLTREPPQEDNWLPVSEVAHTNAASLYLRDLVGGLLNAYIVAFTPSATAADFFRHWPRLYAETLCRVHGEPPRSCGCASGAPTAAAPRVWEYNMATDLRARAAASAIDAFLANPAVATALAVSDDLGPTPDLIQAAARRTLGLPRANGYTDARSTRLDPQKPEQQPYIWAHHDPGRAVSRAALFSETESSRRLDFLLSALDAALEAVRSVTAHLPSAAAHAAIEGSRYRAQISRTFSLPVVVDPGLSPRRADEVLARLAALALDPTFFHEDVPSELDETHLVVGKQMGYLMRPGRSDGARNPAAALQARFAEHVVWMRRTLQVELERAVALRLAFEMATGLDDDREEGPVNCPCPLAGCDRRTAGEGEMEDPRLHHVETIRAAICGHVAARRCLFLAGAETAREDGGWITWRCPVCGKECAWVRCAGSTETVTTPWTAMVEGDLDRVLELLQ